MERKELLDQMQAKYAQLCAELGQTKVQISLLESKSQVLLKEIQKLDEQAGLLKSAAPKAQT